MEATLDRYIESTPGVRSGKPHIAGTRITVGDIKIMYLNIGLSLEEIAATYDLPLSAVYAAVAYYYDHKTEMDAEMERDLQEAERILAEVEQRQGPLPLKEKLERLGRLP